MKQRNLYPSINWSIVLFLCSIQLFCQNNRLNRLELQYLESVSVSKEDKAKLDIQIADMFIAEGDHYHAENYISKAGKDSAVSFDFLFTSAKLLFMQNNFTESMNILNTIETSTLTETQLRTYNELYTYNLNHSLKLKESKEFLVRNLLAAKKDTTGITDFYHKISSSKHYDLKKASRRSRLFPGLGLFYVNEPKKAGTSILLNGIFAGYTAYSIYTKYYFTAVLTGMAQFMRFYNGGRKAALNFASKKNTRTSLNNLILIDEYCRKKYLDN